ncbi:urease accessory protein UreF [bacterium LRH843]|nr:urease accessory protein UreF [bacterium LRH843]
MINMLSLFQLCDSNLPTGAFSHSFGLESYIQEDTVHNGETFTEWLDVFLNEQLVYSEGLASRLVYEALDAFDLQQIWKLDRMLMAQNLPSETRVGMQRMGVRMIEIVESLYDVPAIALYKERIKAKKSFGNSAIVFTILAYHLQVSKKETVLYYLYSSISSLIQNAVRAIPLGQTAGQKIIHEYKEKLASATAKIEQLEEEDFGIASPGLEISQMKHERVNIRIFMS